MIGNPFEEKSTTQYDYNQRTGCFYHPGWPFENSDFPELPSQKRTVRSWKWAIPKGNEYSNHSFSGDMLVSDANQATFQGSPCHREPCHPPGSIGLEPGRFLPWRNLACHVEIGPRLKGWSEGRGSSLGILGTHFAIGPSPNTRRPANSHLPKTSQQKRGPIFQPFCGLLFLFVDLLDFGSFFWGNILIGVLLKPCPKHHRLPPLSSSRLISMHEATLDLVNSASFQHRKCSEASRVFHKP